MRCPWSFLFSRQNNPSSDVTHTNTNVRQCCHSQGIQTKLVHGEQTSKERKSRFNEKLELACSLEQRILYAPCQAAYQQLSGDLFDQQWYLCGSFLEFPSQTYHSATNSTTSQALNRACSQPPSLWMLSRELQFAGSLSALHNSSGQHSQPCPSISPALGTFSPAAAGTRALLLGSLWLS